MNIMSVVGNEAPKPPLPERDRYDSFADFDPQALINAVHYVVTCGVTGHIAEFGCYHGRSAEVIAQAMRHCFDAYPSNEVRNASIDRSLYLFDSFEGFPETNNEVDNESPHIKRGIWGPGYAKGGSPVTLHARCTKHIHPRRCLVVPGWYKDTVPKLPADLQFAMLHMDCDYYESTMDAMGPLFERKMIADGCTILFDDWYCNAGSPKFGQQKAWKNISLLAKSKGYRYSDWGPYGVTGRRFIVHK